MSILVSSWHALIVQIIINCSQQCPGLVDKRSLRHALRCEEQNMILETLQIRRHPVKCVWGRIIEVRLSQLSPHFYKSILTLSLCPNEIRTSAQYVKYLIWYGNKILLLDCTIKNTENVNVRADDYLKFRNFFTWFSHLLSNTIAARARWAAETHHIMSEMSAVM